MIYRWLLKIFLFFSFIGMFNIFLEEECIFALICTTCVIGYMIYRLCDLIYNFDTWGDISKRYSIKDSFNIWNDNYDYLNDKNHITVDGSKSYTYYDRYSLSKTEMSELVNNFKVKEDKIEILETITKEVERPIVEDKFTKSTRVVKKLNKDKKTEEPKKEEKITINTSEFNQDLIMLVNSSKISKDVGMLYDCIIKALKDLKYPSSAIGGILSAFPYVDFVGNQAIIYINKRQMEGVTLSKIKRYIITNINEKFNNEVKTTFENMKYMSVLDYFAKTNAL